MNFLSPQWTLLTGIIISFFLQGHPLQTKAKAWSSKLLQFSVILLGASLNFHSVIEQGTDGALITCISIIAVFILGYLGEKLLKVNHEQGLLITMGTAICGGSAIGALAPVINAEAMSITISIGVVFLLNALAVFIFPFVGGLAALTQEQFGLWSALAIHDTSSVVAASAIYGSVALQVATTVKLIRALWIIPITLIFSFYQSKGKSNKITIPWFIFGFLLLSLIFTFFSIPVDVKTNISALSKLGFAITLFLIGISFDLKKMKSVGWRPLALGISLWVIVSATSLLLILFWG
jgi:uncharacterized integral membrane protein (TIGR00698 family)